METLTVELVTEYLRRAVAEYGEEYVDPGATDDDLDGCQNIYRSEHGDLTGRCIAAQVLHYHGITDAQLEEFNNTSAEGVIRSLGVPTDDVARWILQQAQGYQDEATPWGQAAEGAIADYAEED